MLILHRLFSLNIAVADCSVSYTICFGSSSEVKNCKLVTLREVLLWDVLRARTATRIPRESDSKVLKKVLVYFIMNVLAKRLVQNVVCKVCVG